MTRINEEAAAIATGMTSPDDAPRTGAESTAGASLDKVRDILFGGQMRDFDRRCARLEERLVKEISELKEDVRRRLEVLESYTRQETGALAEQIRREQAARTEAGRDLSREITETARSFESRATVLEEQLLQAQRELRQQLLEQHQRLSDDIRSKVDDVLAALAREAQDLRSEKADRAVLASLLNEMAMRLTGSLPDVEELGNG